MIKEENPKCPKCHINDMVIKVSLMRGLLLYWRCNKCGCKFAFVTNSNDSTNFNPGTVAQKMSNHSFPYKKGAIAIPHVEIVNPGNSLYCTGRISVALVTRMRTDSNLRGKVSNFSINQSELRLLQKDKINSSSEILLIKADEQTFNPSFYSEKLTELTG